MKLKKHHMIVAVVAIIVVVWLLKSGKLNIG